MNQENEFARFLVMPFDIMGLKDLNSTDKLVFARIAGFRRFFEGSQTTADFLGLSKIQVERAKRKLVKLGYVIEIADTGRGKIYRSADFYCILDRIEQDDKNVRPDMTKMSDLMRQKCQTENKYRINIENNGAEAPNEQKFGREDINELVELWEAQTGITIKGQKQQRYALANLIKSRGYEATKALIMAVGDTRRVNDRFAPQIATPRELTGKYSKLERLLLWQERNKTARPFGPAPRILEYKEPEPEPEIERASHEQIEAMRTKLGFKKGAAS